MRYMKGTFVTVPAQIANPNERFVRAENSWETHVDRIPDFEEKVNSRRFIQKLKARGGPDQILSVIDSWLADSKARVAVGGKFSLDMRISNMVY